MSFFSQQWKNFEKWLEEFSKDIAKIEHRSFFPTQSCIIVSKAAENDKSNIAKRTAVLLRTKTVNIFY